MGTGICNVDRISHYSQLTVDVLSWPAVANATHYELWIDYLGGAQLPRNAFIHRTDLTTNQWSLPALLPRGMYRVWVRALRSEQIRSMVESGAHH